MHILRAHSLLDPPPCARAGSLLTLSGPGAYDAAVHCASVSAARRSTSLDEGCCPAAAGSGGGGSGDLGGSNSSTAGGGGSGGGGDGDDSSSSGSGAGTIAIPGTPPQLTPLAQQGSAFPGHAVPVQQVRPHQHQHVAAATAAAAADDTASSGGDDQSNSNSSGSGMSSSSREQATAAVEAADAPPRGSSGSGSDQLSSLRGRRASLPCLDDESTRLCLHDRAAACGEGDDGSRSSGSVTGMATGVANAAAGGPPGARRSASFGRKLREALDLIMRQ